jgi:peptidyl-prolyl cis-trans isomerase B (cyclophilin B)
VTSNRDRRAAARARLEREMAQRAEAARRRRRRQAIIGGVIAAVFVVGVSVWVVLATRGGSSTAAQSSPSASASASAGASAAPVGCLWKPLVDPSATPSPQPTPSGVKDVGTPPANEPRSGKMTMTIDTNQGLVKVEMDAAKTPCTAASFTYLASKNFFNNTKCHRMVPSIGALQCGDPSASGMGGPTYRFADENLPVGKRPAYTKGLVAMANSGPDTNGSQFFFVYKDSELQPQYTVFGQVTEGLDVIDKIAAGGLGSGATAQDGPPKIETIIKSITVTGPTG